MAQGRWVLVGVALLCTVFARASGPAGARQAGERAVSEAKPTAPFWAGDTMVGESVLFVRDGDGSPEARLLFEPTRILSVRSASGERSYHAGEDYVWIPGTRRLTLPPGSAVACTPLADLRRAPGTQAYALTHRDGKGEILFGGGSEYHAMQTLVTYQHRRGAWRGARPAFSGGQLPRTLAALRARRPLRIVLLGDSISTGCNASGWAHVAPFQPPWHELLIARLALAYGVRPTLVNMAVGGTDTAWGVAQAPQVAAAEPGLVILAFGMNDAAGRPAPEYRANTAQMMTTVRSARPGAEFILVAPMLGNCDWTALQPALFPQYRDALASLCGPGVALADLTSVWSELLKWKQDRDLTGNGVNHPNDFGHRVYADVLEALLVKHPGRGAGRPTTSRATGGTRHGDG